MKILLFRDVEAALRFIRRHRERVAEVLVAVRDHNPYRLAALKRHYGARVLDSLLLLEGPAEGFRQMILDRSDEECEAQGDCEG